MLVVGALVLILGLWGAYNDEISWWEAVIYFAITAGGMAVVTFLNLPPTLAVIPGVFCGVILLFRLGIAGASAR